MTVGGRIPSGRVELFSTDMRKSMNRGGMEKISSVSDMSNEMFACLFIYFI